MDATFHSLADAEYIAAIIKSLTSASVGDVLMAIATSGIAVASVYTYRIARITNERQSNERVQNIRKERAKKIVNIINFMLQNRELFNNSQYPISDKSNVYETIIKFDLRIHGGRLTKKTNHYSIIIVRERKNHKNILSFSYMGNNKVEPMSIEIDKEPQSEEKWEMLLDALNSSINQAFIRSRNYHMRPYYEMSTLELKKISGLSGRVVGHVEMNSKMDIKLVDAILSANVKSVSKLVKEVTHIDARDKRGKTFLHYAVEDAHNKVIHTENYFTYVNRKTGYKNISKDYVEKMQRSLNKIISILINEGADVNARDNRGTPIIYSAASTNNPRAISILERAGADVNSISVHNNGTAIHIASHYGWDDVIDRLIEYGAAADRKDAQGETPLHKASASGWPSTVAKLIGYGLSINDTNKFDETPLHRASFFGSYRAISELMRHGAAAGVNNRDKFGDTALHKASMLGSTPAINTLCRHGALVDVKDQNGETPLHKASASRRVLAVRTLIKHGANVGEKDRSGETALHKASSSESIRMIKVLIEHGAVVNEVNLENETPLHTAVQRNPYGRHFSLIVNTFIEYGADVRCRDAQGNTAHDLVLKRIYDQKRRAYIL